MGFTMSTQRQRKTEKIHIPDEIALRSTIDLAEILKKIKAEVEKKSVKYYTPYTLATAHNIKISDAKKILNEAVKQGILRVYSTGRRVKIYVPA